jgi:transposase
VFLDESGFSQRPSVRRTWAPRGQTPVLREHCTWKRLSSIGAIAWRPGQPDTRLFLSLRPGAINSDEIIGFLGNLRRHIRGSVVLIWDGLPAHRSRQVTKHTDAQRQWLTVERLPGYAPELNPVEALWSALNAKTMANYSPDTLGELGGQLRSGIRRLRRRDSIGLNFIKHAGLISKHQYRQLCKAQ